MKRDTLYLQLAAALTERTDAHEVTLIRENDDAPFECVRIFADACGKIAQLEEVAKICAYFDCRWAVYEGNQQTGMFIEIVNDQRE
jgi:hypothetical protein